MTVRSSQSLGAVPHSSLSPEHASESAPGDGVRVRQVLSGWGRYPVTEALTAQPATRSELRLPAHGTVICRGAGRSYGDAAISSHGLVLMTSGLKSLCRLDAATGVLTAEAGLTFADLLQHVVPQGWFPPVTPGTKHVTLGGAVAADVHGKNHHRDGSIGHHLLELELILADGTCVRCGPGSNASLFWATVGGMGLTGIIATVSMRLRAIETSLIVARCIKAPDLESSIRFLDDGEADDQYKVAWMDCVSRGRVLGRSVVMRGHHARRDEVPVPELAVKVRTPFRVPAYLSAAVMNALCIEAFNRVYYVTQGRKKWPSVVDYERFFYPLDTVANWNRLYGRRGFLQYQFMLPERHAEEGIRLVLERVARSRKTVFLAVLKRFGPGNRGLLSFPDRGYTLSLDLPMTGRDVLALLDDLDDVVVRFGGRVYLAKDARMTPARFRSMYPQLGEWLRLKSAVDSHWRFTSDLSRRLGLDAAFASGQYGSGPA